MCVFQWNYHFTKYLMRNIEWWWGYYKRICYHYRYMSISCIRWLQLGFIIMPSQSSELLYNIYKQKPFYRNESLSPIQSDFDVKVNEIEFNKWKLERQIFSVEWNFAFVSTHNQLSSSINKYIKTWRRKKTPIEVGEWNWP